MLSLITLSGFALIHLDRASTLTRGETLKPRRLSDLDGLALSHISGRWVTWHKECSVSRFSLVIIIKVQSLYATWQRECTLSAAVLKSLAIGEVDLSQ
jgi:hypothetical protein